MWKRLTLAAAVLVAACALVVGDVTENVQYLPLHRVTADRPGLLLNNPFGGAPAAPGSNPLWDGLIAVWHLDEESDGSGAVPRLDALGTYDLTDTNNISSAAGVIGNAAHVDGPGQTESFTRTTIPPISGSGGFTIAFWYKSALSPIPRAMFSCSDNVTENVIRVLNDDVVRLFSDPSTQITAVLGSGADSNWHLFVVWWDPSDGKLRTSRDDTAVATSTGTIASVAGPYATEPFYIGSLPNWGVYAEATWDEFYIWGRALTSDERTALYNSGTGIAYPN